MCGDQFSQKDPYLHYKDSMSEYYGRLFDNLVSEENCKKALIFTYSVYVHMPVSLLLTPFTTAQSVNFSIIRTLSTR